MGIPCRYASGMQWLVPAMPSLQVDLVFDLHEDFTTVESTIEVRPWDATAPAGMPWAARARRFWRTHKHSG